MSNDSTRAFLLPTWLRTSHIRSLTLSQLFEVGTMDTHSKQALAGFHVGCSNSLHQKSIRDDQWYSTKQISPLHYTSVFLYLVILKYMLHYGKLNGLKTCYYFLFILWKSWIKALVLELLENASIMRWIALQNEFFHSEVKDFPVPVWLWMHECPPVTFQRLLHIAGVIFWVLHTIVKWSFMFALLVLICSQHCSNPNVWDMGQNFHRNKGTGNKSTTASTLFSRLVVWNTSLSPRTWKKVKCLLMSTSVTLFCDMFNLIGIQTPHYNTRLEATVINEESIVFLAACACVQTDYVRGKLYVNCCCTNKIFQAKFGKCECTL